MGNFKQRVRTAAKAAQESHRTAALIEEDEGQVKAARIVTIRDFLEKRKDEISRALPRHIAPDRFLRIVFTAIRYNPALLECTQESLIAAVLWAAQLGLEPGPLGQVYLVPFKRRDKQGNILRVEAQFIVGYRGYLDLVWRSKQLQCVACRDVCERDQFDLSFGSEERIIHKPALGERGSLIGAYLVAQYRDGGRYLHWLSRSEIEERRKRSLAPDTGPWHTDYAAMAKKTVVRDAVRWMPLSPEILTVAARDESVVTGWDPGEILTVEPIAERESAPVTPVPLRNETPDTIESQNPASQEEGRGNGSEPAQMNLLVSE